MNLESFISNSFDDILSAVAKSKKKHKGVAPIVARMPGLENEYPGVMRTKKGEPVYMVEFDLAVTVGEEKKKGIKGGIEVLGLVSGGGESGSSQKNQTISHLTFRIPISYAE